MAYSYEYPKADHTVDAAIFGLDDESGLRLLLVERGLEPFKGQWALPGGFIRMDETLEEAVARELQEEAGIETSWLEQLYTFGAVDRDPRGRVISTAYLGLVRPDSVTVVGGSDAAAAAWYPVDSLPPLAFDHAEIVRVARDRLRSKARWQPLGLELLEPVFTLTDLQRVYEIILEEELDKRNFRRKVSRFDFLVPTDSVREDGHRPARLYRFDRRRYRKRLREGLEFEV